MLTIRAEQMRVFADENLHSSIQAIIRQNFPVHCAQLGAKELGETVRSAVRRGRNLGFDVDQLAAYVALEFSLGADFSTNPAYPWAQQILREPGLSSEVRMQKLRSKAIFYLAKLDSMARVDAAAVSEPVL
ncbi:MAG TPA: hypothetical protein VG456_09750 [Candidatus Sulfopaludibacter sp.]|jgi:hypothetical protein|nr:hypothetical protein [Candidatus Sulfopaludibacter sp.]